MTTSRGHSLVILAIAALTAAACSGRDGTPAPISPSPLVSPSASSGATVSGIVNIDNRTLPPGMIVTVAGTEIAAPVDSSGHFSLDGVPPGDIQLRFTNAGVDAAIPIQGVAEQEQIHIAVTVSGGSATMTSQQRTDSQHRVGSHGLVSGLSGTCPDLTFTVNGTTIVANASTIFEDGSCSTVQNGTRVEIKGTRQSNGSVLATKVDIDEPDLDIDLKGTVSGLGSACPSLTFTVRGTSVVTNSATRFTDGPCSAIQNGTRLEVEGTRQANGSVLAHEVDIDR